MATNNYTPKQYIFASKTILRHHRIKVKLQSHTKTSSKWEAIQQSNWIQQVNQPKQTQLPQKKKSLEIQYPLYHRVYTITSIYKKNWNSVSQKKKKKFQLELNYKCRDCISFWWEKRLTAKGLTSSSSAKGFFSKRPAMETDSEISEI